MTTLRTCTGWHKGPDGKVEWRQWYTYIDEPCPEHGFTQMKKDPR